MEAESRTFVAPGVVYPPTATRPTIPAAPVTSSQTRMEQLETIPEGSNEDSIMDHEQGSAPPTNEGDLPNEENQPQFQQTSSEQGRPAQISDTPLPGFEATFSGSENDTNNPPHLGGASSRDLANVLESTVEVSDAESSIAESRGKRSRRPPNYLYEVYTHNVEDNQQGTQQQVTTPQQRQCNPQIGILKSPPKNIDNRQPHARDTPCTGLANRSQQPPPQQVDNSSSQQFQPNARDTPCTGLANRSQQPPPSTKLSIAK